jgi:hypothetical protein
MRRRIVSSADVLCTMSMPLAEASKIATSNGMISAVSFVSRLTSIYLSPCLLPQPGITPTEQEFLLDKGARGRTNDCLASELEKAALIAVRLVFGEVREIDVRDLGDPDLRVITCEVETRRRSKPEHQWHFSFQVTTGKLARQGYKNLIWHQQQEKAG